MYDASESYACESYEVYNDVIIFLSILWLFFETFAYWNSAENVLLLCSQSPNVYGFI